LLGLPIIDLATFFFNADADADDVGNMDAEAGKEISVRGAESNTVRESQLEGGCDKVGKIPAIGW
jgi:hypothetical protein